jgi:hypothetical protein
MTAAARDVPTRSRPLVDADAADEDSARAARASASSRARRDIARRISRGRRANGVNNDATTLELSCRDTRKERELDLSTSTSRRRSRLMRCIGRLKGNAIRC